MFEILLKIIEYLKLDDVDCVTFFTQFFFTILFGSSIPYMLTSASMDRWIDGSSTLDCSTVID